MTMRRLFVLSLMMANLVMLFLACFAASSLEAAKKTPSESFTITSINPADDGKSVMIAFSKPCKYEDLKDTLTLRPFTAIRWRQSHMDDKNVLTLKGRFRKKVSYTVVLPGGFVSLDRQYKPGLVSFQIGDPPPEVAFIERRTVIERDSRQMLHAAFTNTRELSLQGFHLPPVIAPMALSLLEGQDVPAGTGKREKKQKKAARKSISLPAPTPTGVSRIMDDRRQEIIPFEEKIQRLKSWYHIVKLQCENRGIPSIFLGNFSENRQVLLPNSVTERQQKVSIPLTFRDGKEKGAVEIIRLQGKDGAGRVHTAERIFRITNIGITYKVSSEGLLLWTTTLGTGKPLHGIRCLAYLIDGSLIDLGSTDDKGILNIKALDLRSRIILPTITQNPLTAPTPTDIAVILAGSTSDVTYVAIDNNTILNPQWIEKKDPRYEQSSLLKGHVFTERGIYRPGEKVHFKGTVRQYRDKGVHLPLVRQINFSITNAKGEIIYNRDLTLSDFGTIADSLTIEPYYPLGTYTIKMRMADAVEQTATFTVQEFRAPRHFVEVDFKRQRKKAEGYVRVARSVDILTCIIRGRYYAGGPVKHGKVRWNVSYKNTSFTRKEHPDYLFGSTAGAPEGIIESGETTLDEKGMVTVSLPIAKEVSAGLYSVEIHASVIDFDGKASSETETYQEEPDYLIGLSPHRTSLERGDTQTLKIVVMPSKGTRPVQGKLTAEIMRQDYTYTLKRNDQGHAYWERHNVYMKGTSIPLKLAAGRATFEFDFLQAGTYLAKFIYRTKDGKAYVSSTQFHVDYGAYRYFDADESTKFERISVQTDKTTYAQGETMRVYIGSRKPMTSLLMTIEREGILEYAIIHLKRNRKYIDIPVQERFGPNVYLSFFGITGRGEFPLHSASFDADAPGFLFGATKVAIRQKPGTLSIRINPGEKELTAEPGATVTLHIDAKDHTGKGVHSELAVAVIDESVLALTRFQTPSLSDLGVFSVPLGVLTGELRNELLKQTPYGFLKNRRLTGGDGDEGDEGKADAGKLRRDFRPVAYFNPMVRTAGDGTASVSFQLPDSMTAYRIYVVACDQKDRFASYQRQLVAKRPFYVEPGLPRFFTKGDQFSFLVSAFNKTKESGSLTFDVKSDARLVLAAEPRMEIKAEDRLLIPVRGEAVQAGPAKIKFSGAFKDKRDGVEMTVPVNSGLIRWQDTLSGTFRSSVIIPYSFPTKDAAWSRIDPGEVQAVLTMSLSPFFRLDQALKYLLDYPYGCVEQTSSRIIPLAALRTLIQSGLISGIQKDEADRYLKPGINRLLSMQVSNGGFAYWPGQREVSPWGSIYAITALTRANMAGIQVPPARLAASLRYLNEFIRNDREQLSDVKAFAFYLLALNGQLNKNLFTDAYRHIDKASRQGGMLMMLAAQAGNALPKKEIISKAKTVMDKIPSSHYGDFYAIHREPAITLMVAHAILKDEKLSGKLSQSLLNGMTREGRWGSTSDTGWVLLALGEYFKGKSFATKAVNVLFQQAGQKPVRIKVPPDTAVSRQLDTKAFLASPTISLKEPWGIDVPYTLTLTFPRLDWADKGTSKGLRVAKRIETLEGGTAIRVGDIVKVTIALQADDAYSFVVLDDPLPAGFVAINTAINTEERIHQKQHAREEDNDNDPDDEAEILSSDESFDIWSGGRFFYPNHFEIRDDRVLAFRDRLWGRGTYEYSYYARAVCEGKFILPQTKVQLMYQTDVVGYTPLSTVTIKPAQTKAH